MNGYIPWYRFKKRNKRRSRLDMFIYWTLVPWGLMIPLKLIYRHRMIRRDHLPKTGGALVVCNHQTMFDGMIGGIMLNERGGRPFARKTLKSDSRLLGWFISKYETIFVDLEDPGPSSLKEAVKELRDEGIVMLFPEGTRCTKGPVQPLQPGVWLLIRRGGAPIVPMAVDGVLDVMPPEGGLKFKGRVAVMMAEPIPSEQLIEMGRDKALAHLRLVMDDLRMELRRDLRSRSNGRWPSKGTGDQSLRELEEGSVSTPASNGD
ncbi:MAG: lysophospholipid acyltransferase family protein [Phycisphaerales bacterium]|nr:lysophospholipid acyltransferase family protein [Phycisphaerales bacterium]|tara:strand:+ start:3004 stop:3789 length:786 start_codon:yes stop_codon:yes gene_type:complete